MGSEGRAEAKAGVEPPAGKPERRVFICYTRAALREVEQFHAVLEKRLQVRSRDYVIFRDIGQNPDERIDYGRDYREVVKTTLETAVCCLVVLVPDILHSKECEIEVNLFKERVDRKENCFFLPVTFVSVKDDMELAAENPGKAKDLGINSIATTLLRINAVDFTKHWSADSTSKAYVDAVEEIAIAIDAEVRRQLGLRGRRRPPPQPAVKRRTGLYAAIAATGLAVLVAAISLTVPQIRQQVFEMLGGGQQPVWRRFLPPTRTVLLIPPVSLDPARRSSTPAAAS
jgi:hypothetical protein